MNRWLTGPFRAQQVLHALRFLTGFFVAFTSLLTMAGIASASQPNGYDSSGFNYDEVATVVHSALEERGQSQDDTNKSPSAIGSVLEGYMGVYGPFAELFAPNTTAGAATGRGKNRLVPDPDATGPHTTFKYDVDTGEISHYVEWKPNPQNPIGYDVEHRFDLTGAPHFNKVTGEYVDTPHVQGPSIPGGVRDAEAWEIPG